MARCEVLVVGAGPTGLAAALELAVRGVDVRLVDQAPERSPYSRALVVQSRTLELLHRHDLAVPLRDRGTFAGRTTLYADGAPVLSVDLSERAPRDTVFDGVLFVSQVDTEEVLEARVRELGVQVERPVALVGFEQTGEGVRCELDRGGVREELHASFLIGADGAHSVVRKGLGLSFEGAPYAADFLLGDVDVDTDLDLSGIHVFLARKGVTILFPMPGARTRVITTARTGEAGPLGLDELERRASDLAERPLGLSEPTWLARFRLHHRGVDRYRVGRGFVAGDAAHIHSPAGGQGMNTGIQDAFNLGFKLAMVCRGQAPDALLDSYHTERWPVGQRLLQFTDRLFSLATDDRQWFTGLRNWLLPLLAPRVSTPERQRRAVRFVSQLGIRYPDSPLGGEDGRFGDGPRPGERLFDERARGPAWQLFASGDASAFRAAVDGIAASLGWVDVTWGPPGHGLLGPGLLLVRPDGYLAFRSSGERVDPFLAWLDRQQLTSSA